jgi:membrane-bound ClpP family serine protease
MNNQYNRPHEHYGFDFYLAALNRRAFSAASVLQQPANGIAAPDLHDMALARRIFAAVVLASLGLVVAAVVLVAVFAGGALPWTVGALLALATIGVIVLGAHAGGHGWFVPLPVLVLAAAWALTAAAGSWAAPAAWVLACLTLLGALGGAVLVMPAIAYRHSSGPGLGAGTELLVGATGVALGPLAPSGVVRVKNETWSAVSLSGPLPEGAPVHVVKVEGLRLLVWSEAGTIPGTDVLGTPTYKKEER